MDMRKAEDCLKTQESWHETKQKEYIQKHFVFKIHWRPKGSTNIVKSDVRLNKNSKTCIAEVTTLKWMCKCSHHPPLRWKVKDFERLMRAFRGKSNFWGCHQKVIFWIMKCAAGFKHACCLYLNQINGERNQPDQSLPHTRTLSLKVYYGILSRKKCHWNLNIYLRSRKDRREANLLRFH